MTDHEEKTHITVRQEDFARAYIRTICAVSGCGVQDAPTALEHDKIDLTVFSTVSGTIRSKPTIQIQTKCQRVEQILEVTRAYSLDIDTYNNLRDPKLSNPRILVVVYVPQDVGDWIAQSPAELIMRYCAYWLSLKGEPEVPNQTAKTVYLQPGNVFTPEALAAMMRDTSNGVDF